MHLVIRQADMHSVHVHMSFEDAFINDVQISRADPVLVLEVDANLWCTVRQQLADSVSCADEEDIQQDSEAEAHMKQAVASMCRCTLRDRKNADRTATELIAVVTQTLKAGSYQDLLNLLAAAQDSVNSVFSVHKLYYIELIQRRLDVASFTDAATALGLADGFADPYIWVHACSLLTIHLMAVCIVFETLFAISSAAAAATRWQQEIQLSTCATAGPDPA